jgi:uncharacterized repeat protein (TIGR03833 family)
MDSQYLKNIKIGMKVTILTAQSKYSTGIINDIAPGKEFDERGIMVRLTNGDIGRVTSIILNELEKNEKSLSDIKKLMEKGENLNCEFKAHVFWSTTYSPEQIKSGKSFELREYGHRASKIIIAKSIAAFLNSDGGNLIVGVRENKEAEKFEIVGINEDFPRIRQPGIDGYKRTIIDEVFRAFFPPKIYNHLDNYISFEFAKSDDKIMLWIKIKKSDSRVFLKLNDREVFMIRVDSENRTLEGEKLVDYCLRRWPR